MQIQRCICLYVRQAFQGVHAVEAEYIFLSLFVCAHIQKKQRNYNYTNLIYYVRACISRNSFQRKFYCFVFSVFQILQHNFSQEISAHTILDSILFPSWACHIFQPLPSLSVINPPEHKVLRMRGKIEEHFKSIFLWLGAFI